MTVKRHATFLVGALALAACAQTGAERQGPIAATRSAFAALGPAEAPDPAVPALDPQLQDGSQSAIIAGLLGRRSVLEPGPLRDVADAVMAANSRTHEAELRAAVLRSEAAQRNWLPRIGPSVSLTSLGDLASSLVLDAVLFDNGGRAAERDYAKADVEVAAAALAQDSNTRVLAALELYLEAEAARARADVGEAALERMQRFDEMMARREAAGVSDRADRQFVAQRLGDLRADIAADRDSAATARAELGAMAAAPLDGVTGLSPVGAPDPLAEPLPVLKARAAATRSAAEAGVARAGRLPGLGASATSSGDGTSGGLVAGGQGIGLGMRAELQAIDARADAADRRVTETREASDRRISQLSGALASADREAAEAEARARQATETFALAEGRFQAGGRSVPELVTMFETQIAASREAVSAPYRAALLRARIAAETGALVDGDRM